jgi:hypothetical protein
MKIESLKNKALTEQEKACVIKFFSDIWKKSEQYTESTILTILMELLKILQAGFIRKCHDIY